MRLESYSPSSKKITDNLTVTSVGLGVSALTKDGVEKEGSDGEE